MRDVPEIIVQLLVIFSSIAVHEFCHAKFADLSGDPTPRMMGRVTLNPIKHFDPLGSLMILVTVFTGYGIGWGKPVMVRPDKMRNPRWDHFVTVAVGPLSNLLMAVAYASLLRLTLGSMGIATLSENPLANGILPGFLFYGTLLNVFLCLFNLIPIGPLDGHWMLGTFMPDPMRLSWYKFNQSVGTFLFLALVLFRPNGVSLLSMVIVEPAFRLIAFLFGLPAPQ